MYTIYIATTPEKLWAALTNGNFTREYWAGHEVESAWQPGAPMRMVNGGREMVRGQVLESQPPSLLSMTWISMKVEPPAPATKVTYTIEAVGAENVKLTVVHEEHEPGSDVKDDVRQGWPAVLSSLKSFLETGSALEMTKNWGAKR